MQPEGARHGPVISAARQRIALAVSAAGAMIVALDGTVLLVAQPSLRRDLGATVTQVQWTSTAYLLAVAALLVLSGRLGDRFGHTRLMLVGVLGFGAASAGIGLAPDVRWVIGLRVAQGVSGALLQPATLALLRLAYPPDRIGTPVAIRTSAIGVAGAAGPLIGGVLIAHLGWRAVFVFNVPFAIAIAAATLAVRIPTTTRPAGRRLDLVGAGLLAAALAVFVRTLVNVPTRGWGSASTTLGLVAVVAVAAVLVGYERRTADGLVPAAVARSRPVMASMTLLLFTSSGMFGALFVATYLLQDARGLDAFASGVRVLPLTVLMVLGAPIVGAALTRIGPRDTAVAGAVLVVLGVLGLARFGPTSVAFALLGAGFAAVMVTATGTVVGDAPPEYAGVVGGLKQTAVNIGPTLGIAVAATTMTARSAGSALVAVAGLAAVSVIPAALLPGLRPAPGPTEERAEAAPSS
jgi:EmrB/QacA subfamily drug resistance transporter